MRNKSKFVCFALASILMSSCASTPHFNDVSRLEDDDSRTLISDSKKSIVLNQAEQIQKYLALEDFDQLLPYIHPTKGVRFSMYAYVQKETDKTFSREQFAKYLQQPRIKFTWGAKDGVGDLYITTLPDFLNNWVAAEQYDFKNATFNSFQGSGNSLNNLEEVYQNADFVEFYHSGKNPQYEGMDWRAMRLVFEEYQGKYYLVAIVNDQWTV